MIALKQSLCKISTAGLKGQAIIYLLIFLFIPLEFYAVLTEEYQSTGIYTRPSIQVVVGEEASFAIPRSPILLTEAPV